MTFVYRPVEDRICINAATPTGETLRLWLTRRLACHLIPHLPAVNKLADSAHLEGSTGTATDQTKGAVSGGASAVECDAGSEQFLIVSIDMKHREEQWSLVFKDVDDDHRAAMTLGFDGRRQIADALSTCFRTAGWSAAELGKSVPQLDATSLDDVTVH